MTTRSQSPFRPPTLTTPTSPKQPQPQPLTPPPRLHLRPLIPSPPLPTSTTTSPPPSPPYPWIWRCHICGSIYRLGVTRRCLDDGHYFCSLPSPPPSPVSPEDGKMEVRSHAEVRRERKSKRQKEKRRKEGRGCRAEFDYKGWGVYNGWRREIRAKSKSYYGMQGRKNEGRGKNCWKDCDFPSECHNEAKAETEWEAYRERERMRGLEEYFAEKEQEEEEGGMSARVINVQNLDGMVGRDLFVVGDGDKEVEMEMEMGDSGSESNGSMFLEDNTEMEDVELEDIKVKGKDMKEKDGLCVLGPIGTDCDGLGESGIFNTHRRKSVDSSMNSPPSSPLKTCNFGFEDKEMGCDVWAVETKRELEIDDDVQMQEALRARSDFLRRCERGDEEEFGDEVPVF